jgi:hypothetical protein
VQPSSVLTALAERLTRLGLLVVPHGDQIAVRLALMTSVRIRIDEGRLVCEPYFGAVKRTWATLVKTGGVSALGFASLTPGHGIPFGIGVAFLALVVWAYDGLRYAVTEACVTQIRQAYGTLLDGQAATQAPGLAAPRERAVGEGEIARSRSTSPERSRASLAD